MNDNIDILKERREILRKKAHTLIFEIFAIFGIPAFGAYFLGKYLISKFELGTYVWIFVLIPSFILGWVIFIFRFRNINNELKNLNTQIKGGGDSKSINKQ